MGKDLYESLPIARELYDRADAILGRALSRLCFEGPAEELSKTTNAQPAIYVTSMACFNAAFGPRVVKSDPLFVSGHSLGEYSALAAAGALSFEDGLRLVERRGQLTQAAAEATPGKMAALLGLDDDAARAVCDETGAELCNLNAPGQVVIGGPLDVVTAACELALTRGARRAIPLDVGGAFHTSLMEPAVAPFREAIERTPIYPARIPLVANDRAEPIIGESDIAKELAYQLTHPVRWVECVRYMAAHGVGTFVEIGPGRVLSGLVKRIAPEAETRNVNGVASIAA